MVMFMVEILQNILYIILSGCGVALAKYIVDFINEKINETQINTEIREHEQLNKYIDDAQKVISNIVLTVSQTYVETLKSHGSFTPEAQKEAKEKAMTMAEDMISEESKNAIIIVYNDFNKFVDTYVEAIVNQNKVK